MVCEESEHVPDCSEEREGTDMATRDEGEGRGELDDDGAGWTKTRTRAVAESSKPSRAGVQGALAVATTRTGRESNPETKLDQDQVAALALDSLGQLRDHRQPTGRPRQPYSTSDRPLW